ncbi:MAG: hypothetical protein GX986_02840 [Firmicutes bacterium]|nr:hypothetical protein [Bacillota bacterium]
MSVAPTTKKEQILALARQDPFLKIEEIAATVETTPPYVRTTLSEAKVSLMELRRNYARRMQKRLHEEGSTEVSPSGTGRSPVSSHRGLEVDEIQVHKVQDAKLAILLGVATDESLLMISRVRILDGTHVVNRLVTPDGLSLSKEKLRGDLPLWKLLGLNGPGYTRLRERSLEVEQADPQIADSLGIMPGEPVLRSGHLIVSQGVPVGLEFNIFPAYAVRLILVGDGDYELKVVGKTG